MTFFHAFLKFFSVADYTRFNHFTQQVVAFTCTFTDSGKNGKAVMFLGNVINQLHNKHGLAYTGSPKQSDFTTL